MSANLLHHAVELLLKACLAHDDPLDEIREYGQRYSHYIDRLWEVFKVRQPTPVASEFDKIIETLHKFENIRYPERLIRNGATISIGVFEVEDPISINGQIPDNLYVLMLPKNDRLMGLLFKASGANPAAFLPKIIDDKQALAYYDIVRATLFGQSTH